MNRQFATRLLVLDYALTILVSALLLFEVQPIISKFILPWFGGSPAVWTTCMVFFQTLLFAGYAYAHLSEKYLRPKTQAVLHVLLMAAAISLLPITPDLSWKTGASDAPTWRILCLLTVSVGLPYFVLSSTGPLVQAWFARSFPGRSPYRLYALSNLGSLVALLGYPFFLEQRFAVDGQAWLWTVGFALFFVLCGIGAIGASWARRTSAADKSDTARQPSQPPKPQWRERLAWVALPALASMMLLATTNHVCQDVAVMPFLWVAPLSLYLLSFIICFDHPRWYWRKEYAVAALFTLGAVVVIDQLIAGGSGVAFTFAEELTLHFAALFCLCMLCHGELVRLRPDPRYLTSFYMMISAGGALGGMFVSLLAPRIFTTFLEWRLGLVVGCLLAAWVVFQGQQQSFFRRRFALIAPALFLAFVGMSCVPQFRAADEQEVFVNARNFYGVTSVFERNVADPARHAFNLYSGRIMHGLQFTEPASKNEPNAYYGRTTGVGLAFAELAERPKLRVGLVGLGVGTVAAYARPGDYFRFYEINPDVQHFAEKYFTFLKDSRGACEVVLGDARLSLESEPPQRFDLLVLDAFSGDAVPTHLLTEEAFQIYQRHLNPGAKIAVHISNRYLDLSRVVAALADRFGYERQRVSSQGDANRGQFPAEWIVLSKPADGQEKREGASGAADASGKAPVLWTDDHSNLFEILK